MSLKYSSLKRPSQDATTIRRNVASSIKTNSTPSSPHKLGVNADVPPPEEEEVVGLDTWTRFLAKKHYVISQQEKKGGGTDSSPHSPLTSSEEQQLEKLIDGKPLTRAQMQNTLQIVVARRNEQVQLCRQNVVAQRQQEEKARVTVTEKSDRNEIENMPTALVLHKLLERSREQWQVRTSQIIDSWKERLTQSPRGTKPAKTSPAQVALPKVEDLYNCLVAGVNSDKTAASLKDFDAPSSVGIEPTGLLTDFKPHVQGLAQYPTVVPPLDVLRYYFAELAPAVLSPVTYDHLGASIEHFEQQLDTVVRYGDNVEQLRALLLEGAHPSIRRLVYPRALQCNLTVTDGLPLFGHQTDIVTNHLSTDALGAYLTCSSKYARDKVKCRFQHHYSSAEAERTAQAMQVCARVDMTEYVGDSDKYFVHEDDVKVLLESLMTDKSIADGRLKSTLAQLGRPAGCFDSYIVYLLSRSGDLILQTAPPCGFVPVSAFSLLVAPICNVTGDTVEQYELLSSFTGQIWSRLQGPTPELLQCALLFESMIAQLAPTASLHLRRTLKFSPLYLALEWLTTGFAELLDPMEELVLWDLLLAYHLGEMHERSSLSALMGLLAVDVDTPLEGLPKVPCALWLMAIFAAAIFVFRAPLIERCTSKQDVMSLFSVGHQLKVRPLLQYILFEATVV